MKIFRKIRQNWALLGFSPNQVQVQGNRRTTGTLQILGIGLLAFSTCLVAVYFFHVADSRDEYMYSLFTLLGVFTFFVVQSHLVFKNDKIYLTIDMLEVVMSDSEFSSDCIAFIIDRTKTNSK